MFRSQAMSKVELIIPRQDVVPITEALAVSGVFHPIPTEYTGIGSASLRGEDWNEQATTFAALERRILAVMEALCVDQGPPPAESPHPVEPAVALMEVEHLEQEAQVPVRELEEEQLKLTQLERHISQLETIANLDVDLDAVRNLRYLFGLLGTMPVANLDRLRSSLEHTPSVLVELRREDHLATVVLFGAQRDAEVLNRAARSAYLNPLKLPETYRGTPAEAIEALQAGVERTRQRIAECHFAIDRLHETRIRRLQLLLWRVRASRTLVEAIARYGRLRYTYLASGWVPVSRVDHLRQRIEETSRDVQIEVSLPRRRDDTPVPVELDAPSFLKAFQSLVTNYGHPTYGEANPTLVLALTFPLVFGVMFGDVGHGLVLALLGVLLATRAVRALRGLAGMGTLLVACGVASMIFGVLYGSVFGNEEILPHLWIQPFRDVVDVLLAAVLIGAGLLSLGMVLSVVNGLLARRWGHALFGHRGVAGLVFYWSLIGLVASVFVRDLPVGPGSFAVAAGLSGLAVAFGELLARLVEGHRPLVEDGFFTYLMQALFELFEMVIGLLSNTLSYVRMGAFAVAHGVLSMVVFIMAERINPGGGVIYWTIVVLGNLFIVGFEGMIVGIQTLRLEYYEFFGKFFSGGGVRYRPLTLVPGDKT